MTELELLQKKLRVLMNDLADKVATGEAGDFSEYKFLTGQIMGLGLAERELLDLAERLRTDNGE